ncbi:MAG TPA: M23 family metallopeptidase [Candidatus Binatia bacterium]|jgi:hypothetical protein|nr:M23 family metallopeptidase [Candidatus Binatia bacterium]
MRTNVAAVAAFAVAGVVSSSDGRTLTVPDTFTPVLAEFVGDQTSPVKATDGKWHVVYELWLTNARPVPATVTRIEVLDYDHQDRVLATLDGATLTSAARELTRKPATDVALGTNESKLVFVELAFDDRARVPNAIVHRLVGTGGVNPAAKEPEPFSYVVTPWDIAERTPPVLGPPLVGDGWVAVNGCCSAQSVHRGAIMPISGRLWDSQRYAIDWLRVDAEGHVLRGDPTKVESFLAYDQPVIAVADGTVVDVLDGLDDQVPGSLPDPSTITIANVDGNHVILDTGKGNFVFYAHLKKGTVGVKLHDRVRRGQQLARLGNTGNTSAPHLHLHVMTEPSALAGDGVPYVFDRFTLAGALDATCWYDPDTSAAEACPLVPGRGRGPRRDEMPLDVDIVDFPAAATK